MLGLLRAEEVKGGSVGNVGNVVCIGGGGGAEVVGLGAWVSMLLGLQGEGLGEGDNGDAGRGRLHVTVVDVADWDSVIEKLGAVVRPLLTTSFIQRDVLALSAEETEILFQGVQLVTVMFTLNELYHVSVAQTTAFLLGLGDVLDVGGWLCVVDSPGSYSGVGVGVGCGGEGEGDKGKGGKRYPMGWLLEHTLLELAREGEGGGGGKGKKWVKVESQESRWFRRAKGLVYGLDLEDMRYQMHLYRRIASL